MLFSNSQFHSSIKREYVPVLNLCIITDAMNHLVTVSKVHLQLSPGRQKHLPVCIYSVLSVTQFSSSFLPQWEFYFIHLKQAMDSKFERKNQTEAISIRPCTIGVLFQADLCGERGGLINLHTFSGYSFALR